MKKSKNIFPSLQISQKEPLDLKLILSELTNIINQVLHS
jgi:hypothetical protein